MKIIIKQNVMVLAIALLIPMQSNSNGLIADNKTAYELAALAAYEYLNYTYEKGATGTMCSAHGQGLCRILGNLTEKTRLFSHPAREDLKELSKLAMLGFRDFDYNGTASDRKFFVQSLMYVLQATLPLLEGDDITECRLLIRQLAKTISLYHGHPRLKNK